MMSDSQMDNFINDRLKDYPSPVPANMWNRIVKKKDRKILLFFFRLLGILILSLMLAGGYFAFKQKILTGTQHIENPKINQTPSIANSLKPTSPNVFSDIDQVRQGKMQMGNKNVFQTKKSLITNSDGLEFTKANFADGASLSRSETKSDAISNPGDSTAIEKNNKVNKKDSLGAEPIVKTDSPGSVPETASKKPETKKKLNNRKWHLDLFASPDYPIISPHEFEQARLSYTVGIKLNRSFGSHFSAKTGVQFSQINIAGEDSVLVGKTLQVMRLDLPVLAGYSIGDEKFRTTFNAGVIFNLYTWAGGNSLADYFKTNTGLSLYLGVDFEQRIKERISIFGEPFYRYQLTPMTVSSISSLKFIDIAGISIGARYFFGK